MQQWLDEHNPKIAKRTQPVNGRVDDILPLITHTGMRHPF
jgi:hypothetical protein